MGERAMQCGGIVLVGAGSSARRSCWVNSIVVATHYAGWGECITLSYMKNATVTIRLDPKLQRQLDRLSKRLGRSRSDVVRDALRRQIALLRFEDVRRGLLPLAEAKGIVTDDDVFDLFS